MKRNISTNEIEYEWQICGGLSQRNMVKDYLRLAGELYIDRNCSHGLDFNHMQTFSNIIDL